MHKWSLFIKRIPLIYNKDISKNFKFIGNFTSNSISWLTGLKRKKIKTT
jgi:hypothetical protein